MADDPRMQERWRWMRAANAGMSIAAPILGFGALGFYLDHRRGGGVAFTLGGIALGFVSSIYELWKLVRELDKK